MEKFTKQIYEEFTIAGDFSKNMETGETIATQTVVAVNNVGADATNDVLDTGSISNDGTTKVLVLVRAGTEALSPYKITFKAVTSVDHKWEVDVQMKIKEI